MNTRITHHQPFTIYHLPLIMRLAVEARQTLEEFFRAHYGNPQFNLPPIRLFQGRFAHIITGLLGISGITLGRSIIIAPRHIARRHDNARSRTIEGWLLAHEVAHVLQYERDGWSKFLRAYVGEYFSELHKRKSWNRSARELVYLNLAAEREARAVEQAFLLWWDMRRYETDDANDFAHKGK